MGVKESERLEETPLKLCIVLTTRGSYGKFKRLIHLARKDPFFKVQIVVGGELILQDRVTSLFDITPDYICYFNIAGDTRNAMAKSTGAAIQEFCNAFETLKPDIVMLVGDRFETLGAATAAYIQGIKIAHLEGGEKSGTLDDKFRNVISEFTTFHFPCTIKSKDFLSSRYKGLIKNVGATSLDSMFEIKSDQALEEFQETTGIGPIIDISKPFLLVIYHPDTKNLIGTKYEIGELINAIDNIKMPTIWLNSNIDAGSDIVSKELRIYRDQKNPSHVRFMKGLPIEYFSHLLWAASCIVGNSSAGIRESSFRGTPSVNIGLRQVSRETDKNVLNVITGIEEAIRTQLKSRYGSSLLYGDGLASKRILEALKCI